MTVRMVSTLNIRRKESGSKTEMMGNRIVPLIARLEILPDEVSYATEKITGSYYI